MEGPQLLFLILLIACTTLLYFLPFIPAIIEWKTKADSEPVHVNFQDRSLVEYCIRMFRDTISQEFASLLEKYKQSDINHQGTLANGVEYHIINTPGPILLSELAIASPIINKVLLMCSDVLLPNNLRFENKIYAIKSLETGINNCFHEVIAEGDIQLNRGGIVRKLLFSESSIFIHNHCVLEGYTRASTNIHLLGEAQFHYLSAPFIAFGNVVKEPPDNAIDVFGVDIPRKIIGEKLVIPSHSQHTNHLVAKKELIIENDCIITGNIKCHKDVRIERNTTIIGALFAEQDINIADNCSIQGPIVSKGTIRIGKNCMIGTKSSMTSLIAQQLYISDGCCALGLVLAKQAGFFNLEQVIES